MQRLIGIVLCFALVLNGFGQDTSNVVKAVELVRMNVLYVSVDNPIKIAISNIPPSDLSVGINNGTVTGGSGEYIIRPTDVGSATLTVYYKGDVVHEANYRVKSGFNIYVAIDIAGEIRSVKGSCSISKEDLIKSSAVRIILDNSDFDMPFEVVSFTISLDIGGNLLQASSNKGEISDKQKEIIAKADPMSKIYIEDINVKGPDDTIRRMGSVVILVL